MRERELIIREAVPGDARALGPLADELGYPNDPSQTAERLSRVLEAPGNRVFVAEDAEHQPIGWIHVFGSLRVESDGFAELGGLVVAESWRSRGVGRRLVAEASRWALESGFSTLRIRSRVGRTEAHGFFEHLGYFSRKTQRVFERSLTGEP